MMYRIIKLLFFLPLIVLPLNPVFADWTIILYLDADNNWGMDVGELNMGKPETLIDFVNWGISNNPGDQYAVVIYNHGSGWVKKRLRRRYQRNLFRISNNSGVSWTQFDEQDGIAIEAVPQLFFRRDSFSGKYNYSHSLVQLYFFHRYFIQ